MSESVSGVVKRSLTIRGHRTSISLEDPFWQELQSIAAAKGLPLARLVADLDATRPDGTNLSSMLRLHVLEDLRARARARNDLQKVGEPGTAQ